MTNPDRQIIFAGGINPQRKSAEYFVTTQPDFDQKIFKVDSTPIGQPPHYLIYEGYVRCGEPTDISHSLEGANQKAYDLAKQHAQNLLIEYKSRGLVAVIEEGDIRPTGSNQPTQSTKRIATEDSEDTTNAVGDY